MPSLIVHGVNFPISAKAKPNSTHARALGGSKRESAQDILDKAKADGIKWRRSAMSPNGWIFIALPQGITDARCKTVLKALKVVHKDDWKVPKEPNVNLSRRPYRKTLELEPAVNLSVPELVDILIARHRKTKGFQFTTFKQRADLMLALLAHDQ